MLLVECNKYLFVLLQTSAMSQNGLNISQIEVLRNMMETAMYRICTAKAVKAMMLCFSSSGLSRVDNLLLITQVNCIVQDF